MTTAKSFYKVFGAMLSDARRKGQISQQKLASSLGLTRTSVTNIEKGRQPIQLHSLYVIAKALRVEVKELLPSESALVTDQPNTNVSVSRQEWLETMNLKVTDKGALANAHNRATGKRSARG